MAVKRRTSEDNDSEPEYANVDNLEDESQTRFRR